MNRMLLCIAALVCVGDATASAAIMTFMTRDSFDAAFPVRQFEGWDTFPNGTTFPDGSTTNGITYNSSGPGAAIVTNVFFNTTNPNSLGDTDNVNFFGGAQSITFSFANPASAFGIDINTFANINGAYTATTNNGDVIGSFFNPFPGGNTGQFIGFSSTEPFTSVTITPTTGLAFTLDSMRIVAAPPIPEPATLAAFGVMAAAGAGYVRRRLKHQAVA